MRFNQVNSDSHCDLCVPAVHPGAGAHRGPGAGAAAQDLTIDL